MARTKIGLSILNTNIVQTTTTSSTTTTSATYVNTNVAATITPSSATSRIKITVSSAIDTLGTGTNPQVSLFRGSTDLDAGTSGFAYLSVTSTQPTVVPCHFTYIDSPSTSSATTYTVKLKQTGGGGQVQFICGVTSTMILEEIN